MLPYVAKAAKSVVLANLRISARGATAYELNVDIAKQLLWTRLLYFDVIFWLLWRF